MLSLVIDGLNIGCDIGGPVGEDKSGNFIEDELHDVLALITETIVDVAALDKEHVHSNLKWRVLSNLENGILVLDDLLLE